MVIPMVLRRLGLDPALATGPFLTTLNDVMGILVYLTIAYAILL
jgi:magnesium transporter